MCGVRFVALETDLDAPTRSHDLIGARARPFYANAIAFISPHQNPPWSRSHYTLRAIAFFGQSHQFPLALRLSPDPLLVFAFKLDASVPFATSHTSNANPLHRIWSSGTTCLWRLPERARVCELASCNHADHPVSPQLDRHCYRMHRINSILRSIGP